MSAIHPCFSREALGRHGRMHLPVAPRCNIQCGYCDRRYSCVNESRPGVTARVVAPAEALELALRACDRMPGITVAGIAGPGDPLANPEETLETLRLVHSALPHLLLCLSTNGLALPEYADDLANLGVSHITVTVNAVDEQIGAKIYTHVESPHGALGGQDGARRLLAKQLKGIERIVRHGLALKVNMVIVPGINDAHAWEVAKHLAGLGASLMNCLPLAPVKGSPLGHIPEPSPQFMHRVRACASKWLPQMTHCSRCRADAVGLLGEGHILTELEKQRATHFCALQTPPCKAVV